MFWLILGLAAALRILFLGIKPPHFDEGINGWFVDQMVKDGFYRYDPTNYHGPLHFYLLFLSQTLFGRNLYALRLPVVLASIGAVWLALKYDRVIPRPVARLAALAMALSPGFIFYGRYSIHEVWLLLFSMMFIFGLLGLWREGTLSYLWFTGMGITGMILTKETYIIHLGCALLALPIAYASTMIVGVEDSKPACGVTFLFRTLTLRFLAIMGVGTFMAYSIIHYKTPWCIISIIWPLLFAFGAFVLVVPRRFLVLSSVVACILLGVSFGYAISLNYFRCTSFIEANWDRNRPFTTNIRGFFNAEPYVYVQTYNDIYKLTTPLLELARRDPRFYHLVGHIIRPSPYPLPWILGDFPQIGYYEHDNNPAKLDADFLLVEESKIDQIEKQLHDSYFTEPLTIRPYQDTSKVFLRVSVFQEIFPGRLPNIIGRGKQ